MILKTNLRKKILRFKPYNKICKLFYAVNIIISDNAKGEKDKELRDMQTRLDQTVTDMKKFYDVERFDINYLADAVLFTKAE